MKMNKMKYLPLFEQFVNEATETPIEIVYYSEVLDNWGKTESSEKPAAILAVFEAPADWTDDMTFEDKAGNQYMIDDLIGKTVKVGGKTFVVPEYEEEVEESEKQTTLITFDDLSNHWDGMYGEEFAREYSGLTKVLKKNYPEGFSLAALAKEWDAIYGEDFKENAKDLYNYLQSIFEPIDEAKNADIWTRERLLKELKSLKQGAKENEMGEDAAFDVADSWLADNIGVEKTIKKYYPAVSDFQGFVANWIA